jgi:hypothetical protein
MNTNDIDIEATVRQELRDRAGDIFDDTIASLFGDKEAIKKAMTETLLKEQAVIMARVLGMEYDPFSTQKLRIKNGNDHKIVGALAPLEQLAEQAVQEMVASIDLDGMKGRVALLIKKCEKNIIDHLVSNADWRIRSETEQKFNRLVDEMTTRMAEDTFKNLAVLRRERYDRQQERQRLADARRMKKIANA